MQPAGQTGTITCQTSFVASTVRVTVVLRPAGGSLATGSSSPVSTLVIGRASARVSLSVSGSVMVGGKVTFTAKLTPPAGSVGTIRPSGMIRFLDGKKAIAGCSRRKIVAGAAKCTVRYTSIGARHIVLAYGGDANFNAVTSPAKLVTIRPISPTGLVTSLMQWIFHYHLSYTKIGSLIATGLSPQTTISLVCTGPGCPFHRHTVAVATGRHCTGGTGACSTPSSIDLTPIFRGAHLRVGTTITVRISHTGWLGKYYRFVIVAGQRPQIIESCLAVDSSRPGVGCS